MPDNLPGARSPHYIPSDDGFVPEADRAPESEALRAARAEVEALRAQLAIAQPKQAPTPGQDRERVFPKGTTVNEVHEFDALERERALLQRGLDRLPPPLPEGTVSLSEEDLRVAQGGIVAPPRIDP